MFYVSIDVNIRIGGETTMQGRGGVNPSPGTGEVWGLKRSIDRISSAIPSTRLEAKRLGGLGIAFHPPRAVHREAHNGATMAPRWA